MGSSTTSKNAPPSSNWLALQKKVAGSKRSGTSVSAFAARKKRKLSHPSESPAPSTSTASVAQHPSVEQVNDFPKGESRKHLEKADVAEDGSDLKNGESVADLRRMVLGQVEHSSAHQQPGKYLALDCEMVGVGIDGAESVLARVSLVNFYGHILLDAIVRPRERVVDYRTQFSGIRPSDMVNARPFEEVQKQVADLLKDRILVGHAVHNDLKALLLSHPRPQTRDTQHLAFKHKAMRARRPALRNLVQQELGLQIQGGEHSSVTDARATMAVFRIHRKTWEKGARALPLSTATKPAADASSPLNPRKRPHDDDADADTDSESELTRSLGQNNDIGGTGKKSKAKAKTGKAQELFPGGGRRGVSSGLSTVVKRIGDGANGQTKTKGKTKTKEKWWKELGGGSKGSVRLKAG